jgi:hypothetical protein
MVYVCLLLAFGLGVCAYRSSDRTVRLFLAAFCLLNAAAAGHAIYVKDPYAFKLRPNNGAIEDNFRRP